MLFTRFLVPVFFAAAVAGAAEPLDPPVPFVTPPVTSAGQTAVTYLAAKQAQEMGLPTVAVALYRQLLVAPGADRQSLTLDLATALLDEGRPEDASRELFALPTGHNAAWHLREALAQADLRRFDLAAHELSALRPNDLSPEDRAWLLFLEGRLAAARGDREQARTFYTQAENAATTDLARARFLLAAEQDRLMLEGATEQTAREMQKNASQYQGTPVGYDFARFYAVMLNELGRKTDAIGALRLDLLALPAQERDRADDFRLLLGLIAGPADPAGRTALIQLLESGSNPDRQLVALRLLGMASEHGSARTEFRAELDKLIAGNPPIAADLYQFRAEWELGDRDDTAAIDDADAILNRFPGSSLKGDALAVLTTAAWDQHRYRTAADFALRAREALGPGELRAQMGVLAAEALFRAGQEGGGRDDFRQAAAAYAAALTAPPQNVAVGDLMFQRVEAEIKAGSLERAQTVLDELARSPSFDVTSRWEAEWNLVRALQLHGQVAVAYQRINALLAAEAAAVPPGLRARMQWLQAQVSFDAGEYGRTLILAEALIKSTPALEPAVARDIAASAQLLRARAYFNLREEPEGLSALAQLRSEAPGSQAVVDSYLVEAEHYAGEGKIVPAQQTLRKLADGFPKSPEAPYALLQSAYLAERLGQEKDLNEATALLKELIDNYPTSDLYFEACLKDGDVLREVNRFPDAQLIYEHLINQFSPSHPGYDRAELALADCHFAQAGPDSDHEERARSLYEVLLHRVDADPDIRVEAGYKLGAILVKRRGATEAKTVWFRDVVHAFLLDPAAAANLGAPGAEWMTRTLLDLGALDREEGHLEEAQTMWRLILERHLPGAHLARANLDALVAGTPKS